MNERERLVVARIKYLRALREYQIATRDAEVAIARERVELVPIEPVPALLMRQAG